VSNSSVPDSVESLQRLAPFVMGRPHLIWGFLGADSPNAWLFGSLVLMLFIIGSRWLVAA
jgi:hypothetical protein